MYDLIIIGAGYSGSRLSGLLEGYDVLVLDKMGIGEREVSAVTFTDIVEESVIRNSYESYALTTVDGEIDIYDFGYPVLSLIDYKKLCKSQIAHDVVRERVVEYGKGFVVTEDSKYRGRVIVDCSGFQGKSLREKAGFKNPPYRILLSFTEIARQGFIESNVMYLIIGYSNGGGWIYPCNGRAEFGFAMRTKDGGFYPDLSQASKILGLELEKNVLNSEYSFGFVKRVVKGNIVLFGDSCGMAHPTYMTTIHYIHKISERLARALKEYIDGDGRSLERYQEHWREMLKKASGNIASGYAFWDLDVEKQIDVAKTQIRSRVKPESILDHMRAFDERYEMYAKNVPKLRDYPLEIYLNYIKHKISILLPF